MQLMCCACSQRVWCPAAAVDTVPEEEPTYAADVLEEVGQAVAQRCFWDFGRCSDLQRDFRPVDNGRRRDIPVDLEVNLRKPLRMNQHLQGLQLDPLHPQNG